MTQSKNLTHLIMTHDENNPVRFSHYVRSSESAIALKWYACAYKRRSIDVFDAQNELRVIFNDPLYGLNVNNMMSPIKLHIHCVPKRVYHPINNDNFNSSCPIPVMCDTILSKYAIERWFNFPPHLFNVGPYVPYLGNFKTLKITNSAVKEHLVGNEQS